MPYLESLHNPWLVTLCASFVSGISASYVQSTFLFVMPVREIFHASYRDASYIGGISLSLLWCGILANFFFNHFGYRVSIMGAALLCTFSQACAAFTTEYWLFVLLLGFLNGLGVSVLFNGPVMVAGYLFSDKDRHKAMAIVYAGVGGGLMLMPIIFEMLYQVYSFRGCLVILAGLTLHIFVAGSLMPDHLIFEDKDRKYSRGTSRDAMARYEEIVKNKSFPVMGDEKSQLQNEHPTDLMNREPNIFEKFLDTFRPHLLRDWRLQVLNAACFFVAFILAVMSSFNESILVVNYDLGLTDRTALVAAGGAASVAGRLSVGLFPKTKILPRWWIWSLCGFSEGLSMALLGLLPCAGLSGAAVAQILYGYTLGFIFTMHAVVLGDVFPSEDFAAAYGFNAFVMMIASLVAPIFSGWIGDVTNSFRIPLYFAGFSQMTLFLFPLVGLFVNRCYKKLRSEGTPVHFSSLDAEDSAWYLGEDGKI